MRKQWAVSGGAITEVIQLSVAVTITSVAVSIPNNYCLPGSTCSILYEGHLALMPAGYSKYTL
jgi:hypothetical protein